MTWSTRMKWLPREEKGKSQQKLNRKKKKTQFEQMHFTKRCTQKTVMFGSGKEFFRVGSVVGFLEHNSSKMIGPFRDWSKKNYTAQETY